MNSFDILSKKTPLQHRLFLEASAGTGKTFTIEHLVVRLLLETDIQLEQILIVTFTRAATRELKVRIESNLEKAGEKGYDYSSDLTEEQLQKIKTAFLTFDQASIFTIHGFCHRLLQEFAFETSVGLDLKEWEEDDERWALQEFLRKTTILSPSQLLKVLGFCRNDPERLIHKLLSSSDAKGKSFEELLHTIALPSPFPLMQIFTEIRPHYKGMTSKSFDRQAEVFEQALQRGKLTPEEFDYFIGEDDFFLEGVDPSNVKAKSKIDSNPAIEELRKRVLPQIEEARNVKKIIKVLSRAWHEERKKLSLLQEKASPDDLLKMVAGQLSEPSFCEKVRKKYRAVIVDEFQDTDPLQWKIFETLFMQNETRLYLIGDPKQSIYAFRQADIYTFLNASNHFTVDQKAALTTNYRSSKKLIHDLNRLFSAKPWLDLPKIETHLPIPQVEAAKEGVGELCFMRVEGEIGLGKRWPTSEIENNFLFPFIVHEMNRLRLDPKEIGILVKDRYQALSVKNTLDQWKIPSTLLRHQSLGDSPMIEMVQEVIDALFDTSAIKKVLLGPFFKMKLHELTPERVFQAKSFFSELEQEWWDSGFAAFIGRFLKESFLDDEELYEDLMQIVEKVAHIQDPAQLKKAVQLLKIEETDDRISSQPQGIQIMTIHASKGLEFDTVFALGLGNRTPIDDQADVKEIDAEKMRQLYVALTRAKSRLYVPLLQEMSGKPIVAGSASPLELFQMRTAFDPSNYNTIDLHKVDFDLTPYNAPVQESKTVPPRNITFKPLFLQSFTSLSKPSIQTKIVPDNLLPAGAETGILIHRIFERFFNEQKDLSELISHEVQSKHLEGYETVIFNLMNQVLDIRLDGFCLRDIDPSKLITEMEFLLAHKEAPLKGFIDLCFEHREKYYLIDWKTNILENYLPKTIEKTMEEHDYFLQGKIYLTALEKYVRSPCHAYFIFVRGPAAFQIL